MSKPFFAKIPSFSFLLPLSSLGLALIAWQWTVTLHEIPPYILPSPLTVLKTLHADWAILAPALANTLFLTFLGLLVAVLGGVGLAILFSQSKFFEAILSPFAVIFQVTPIVAIFPLINIYVDEITVKLLLCTFIAAFFPILSNTTLGLKSANRNLHHVMQLYGANRWQKLVYLELPSALPHFLTGLKIAGGLALIGSVVAEFVAGSAGSGTGLATRLIEAGFRLNMPRLFACLILISLSGMAIYAATSLTSRHLLRRWHESAGHLDS